MARLGRPLRRTLPARLEPLLTHASLACAVVPFAIAVHMLSEGVAIDAARELPAFFLRHAYLLMPLAGSIWFFAWSLGLGRGRAEIVRRYALMRRRLRDCRTTANVAFFIGANLTFFAVTQGLEGVPITAGSLPIACVCAVLGALLSALVFFVWGATLGNAVLAGVFQSLRPRPPRPLARHHFIVATRRASAVFSLFSPNRPPPQPSFS